MTKETTFEQCSHALDRIQNFDTSELARSDELGRQLSFADAIAPAQSIVDVYKRIPMSILSDLTEGQLGAILGQANSDYNLFDQVMRFDPTEANSSAVRHNLIGTIKNRRDLLFDTLWQFIAFGVARNADTSLLEAQARSTLQSIRDEASNLTKDLNAAKIDADAALSAIRAVASEQGVSQQAHYFKDEAILQEGLAKGWLNVTYGFSIAVGIFAIIGLFLHKFPWLRPESSFDAIQLVTGKILIFALLAFLLIMAARNYSTHKHNAVVNRHRQNALLTYTTLVQAAADGTTQDIVLAHAASCIFSPQDTGFTQLRGDSPSSKSVLELLTKSPQRHSEN